MAVDDIATALPSTSAPPNPSSQGRDVNENSQPSSALPSSAPAIVNTTCDRPSPNTSRRIARSLCRLNSSPMTNIRNTTPNSARYFTAAESRASARALGPINTPTAR